MTQSRKNSLGTSRTRRCPASSMRGRMGLSHASKADSPAFVFRELQIFSQMPMASVMVESTALTSYPQEIFVRVYYRHRRKILQVKFKETQICLTRKSLML